MPRVFAATIYLSVLLIMALGLGGKSQSVHAAPDARSAPDATYTVNTASDTNDVNAGNGFCVDAFGFCSLRAAIQESNANAGADTIVLANLPTNQFAVADLPSILYPVTIEGQGRDVTIIKANGVDQAGLDLRANVTLRDLSLRGFVYAVMVDVSGLTIAINNSRLYQNQTALVASQASTVEFSQSILNANTNIALVITNGATVNLLSSGLQDNTALNCAAAYVNSSGTLSAYDSFFSANHSSGYGGAICNMNGTVALVDSNVSGNTAVSWGGGLYQTNGQMFIKGGSRVQSNHASSGGGVYISSGSLLVAPLASNWPEIVSNTATVAGAGLYLSGSGPFTLTETLVNGNVAPQSAGILFAGSGTLTIRDSAVINNTATGGDAGGLSILDPPATLWIVNSTFSGNQSTRNGGGLYLYQGTVQFFNVTVANNTCNSDNSGGGQGGGIYRDLATVTVRNTIVAGNIDLGGAAEPYAPDVVGAVGSTGYNLIGVCNFFCTITGSQIGNRVGVTNPGLDPLSMDDFAPRPYSPRHPLQAPSPAVDGGDPAGCVDQVGTLLTLDQLGWVRTNGRRCDMGASESPYTRRYVFLPQIIR